MRKRNRLLSSSQQTRIFKSERMAPKKNHHMVFLSLLAFAGISLTTIVLATNQPVQDNETRIISLPGQQKQDQDKDNKDTSAIDSSPLEKANNNLTEKSSNHDNLILSLAEPANIVGSANSNGTTLINALETEAAERQHAVDHVPVTEENAATKPELSDKLEWREIEVASGDNLSLIFPKAGLTARDVYEVAQTEDAKALLNLKPGQTLRLGLDHNTDSAPELKALELDLSPVSTLLLESVDEGYQATTTERAMDQRQKIVGGEIKNSLFVDAQKAGMSDKLIMEMAYIFGWDIDFALDLRQGDNFKVIYSENYLDGNKITDGDILAAEFTNRGKTFRAIRYTDSEGRGQYYTPEGASMRKAFTRTPVPISRISSGFNPNRKHPVLKTNRPHRGVDYAAATGTPILATGDGKVSFVGNKGGYGRTVILSHGGKYTTLFAHMSRYKKGLHAGQRVRQGETIGYIGSSGLATGPHLHYEFRVSGVHKNPLTVELPKANNLPEQYRHAFKEISGPLLAKLDTVEIPSLAFNQE